MRLGAGRHTSGMDNRIADLRKSYERAELDEAAAANQPMLQFETWLKQAIDAQIPEPNAMTLATVAEGRVERVSNAEADAYFASRPLDSRIGAWASPQSQVIKSRAVLVAQAARYAAQFALSPPRPPHWGGFRLVPDRWEFWQGRKSRLHDRLRYRMQDGQWLRERLAP